MSGQNAAQLKWTGSHRNMHTDQEAWPDEGRLRLCRSCLSIQAALAIVLLAGHPSSSVCHTMCCSKSGNVCNATCRRTSCLRLT